MLADAERNWRIPTCPDGKLGKIERQEIVIRSSVIIDPGDSIGSVRRRKIPENPDNPASRTSIAPAAPMTPDSLFGIYRL
ncbi:MAG: hypothetical protein AAF958_09525 [Planctomycetota bacterium]